VGALGAYWCVRGCSLGVLGSSWSPPSLLCQASQSLSHLCPDYFFAALEKSRTLIAGPISGCRPVDGKSIKTSQGPKVTQGDPRPPETAPRPPKSTQGRSQDTPKSVRTLALSLSLSLSLSLFLPLSFPSPRLNCLESGGELTTGDSLGLPAIQLLIHGRQAPKGF